MYLDLLRKYIRESTTPFLVLSIGPPGAGKTTTVRYLLSGVPHSIINRDLIREELFGDTAFHREKEDLVSIRCSHYIKIARDRNYHIGMDNTHNLPMYITKAINEVRYKDILILSFNISIEDCEKNISNRFRKVDREVIVKIYNLVEDCKKNLVKTLNAYSDFNINIINLAFEGR